MTTAKDTSCRAPAAIDNPHTGIYSVMYGVPRTKRRIAEDKVRVPDITPSTFTSEFFRDITTIFVVILDQRSTLSLNIIFTTLFFSNSVRCFEETWVDVK